MPEPGLDPTPPRADAFGALRPCFARVGGATVVAPTVWPLVRALGAAIDQHAAARALLGLPLGESTVFAGVRRLGPGRALREGRPWRWRHEPWTVRPIPQVAAARALREGVGDALARAQRQSPGLTCALSGGLDSAALLALWPAGPRTAAVLADDFLADGEARRARTLARRLGARVVEVDVREEELPDHMEETVAALEEPIWNPRAIGSLLFYRRLRGAGVPAVASGVGADELLWGDPDALRRWRARRAGERRLAARLLTPEVRHALRRARAEGRPLGAHPRLWARRALLSEVLPESTLPPEARGSAHEGVRLHLPYLDDALATWAQRLPPGLRVRDGVGKWLLRVALCDVLPTAVCWQPKRPRLAEGRGRSPRAARRWREALEAWLAPPRLAELPFVDPRAVRRLLADPRPGPGAAAVLLRLASLSILNTGVRSVV